MSKPAVCVACHTDEEVFVFETFSGAFHSACNHAMCEQCLEQCVLGHLPYCRRTWLLRVPCLAEGCGRYIPQALVLKVKAAQTLAVAINTADTWPELPNEDMRCPRCQTVKDKIYVNKACGDAACEECWLADLEPKLEWCKANYTLDIPCGHQGCPEGCLDVLTLFESPLLPKVTDYVQNVKTEMKDFSDLCVHGGPPGIPGPNCPVCGCKTFALLHCACGYTACKQCWEASLESQLRWCKENFAFAPALLWHGACTMHQISFYLSPTLLSPIRLHAQDLRNQLAMMQKYHVPRGNEGPTCPICNEVSVALLQNGKDQESEGSHRGHSSHADHAACEQCWARWAEEQLSECYLHKRAPARCLWPECSADVANSGFWELVQRKSARLQELMDGLRRRKRLQNNPMYPAEFHVECPHCLGLGYQGFDTIMCFMCERQWEADSGDPPETCQVADGDELQLCPGLRVRKCPNCKEYIEKNGGCDHMTCRCRHQFSWTTLKPWRTG